MTPARLYTRTSVALAATALLVAGCSAADEPAAPSEEQSPVSQAAQEADLTVEPGLATCAFNNEVDEQSGDGTGVNPFGELARAEVREKPDAYVVTFTGDFFDPEVLLDEDANGNVQLLLTREDPSAPSTSLMTEFRRGEIVFTGTVLEQEPHEQDTGATFEDGVFTATYPKDSPHLDGLEPAMWTASVYFDDGNEKTRPVGFRCGDGRSWDWEPAA